MFTRGEKADIQEWVSAASRSLLEAVISAERNRLKALEATVRMSRYFLKVMETELAGRSTHYYSWRDYGNE